MSAVVYVLLSSSDTMVAEGQLVDTYDILSGGVLRLEQKDGSVLYLAPGEWRRMRVGGGDAQTWRYV